jgi:hypothetical protein
MSFKIFPQKWRMILLISYFSFLITFITGCILIKFYPSAFSTAVFWAGFILCFIHLVLKLSAYWFNKINIFNPSKSLTEIK